MSWFRKNRCYNREVKRRMELLTMSRGRTWSMHLLLISHSLPQILRNLIANKMSI